VWWMRARWRSAARGVVRVRIRSARPVRVAVQPGSTTTDWCGSRMMAGPGMGAPGLRSARAWTMASCHWPAEKKRRVAVACGVGSAAMLAVGWVGGAGCFDFDGGDAERFIGRGEAEAALVGGFEVGAHEDGFGEVDGDGGIGAGVGEVEARVSAMSSRSMP
jgi:hypothetical protein